MVWAVVLKQRVHGWRKTGELCQPHIFLPKLLGRRVDNHQWIWYVYTPFQEFYTSICFLVWVAQTSPRESFINTWLSRETRNKAGKIAMPEATSFRIEPSTHVKLQGVSQLKPPRKLKEGRSSSFLLPFTTFKLENQRTSVQQGLEHFGDKRTFEGSNRTLVSWAPIAEVCGDTSASFHVRSWELALVQHRRHFLCRGAVRDGESRLGDHTQGYEFQLFANC